MKVSDVVYIKDYDELGEDWGVVRLIDDDGVIHVAIANGEDAPHIFDRDELQRPRDQRKARRRLGLGEA